MRILTRLEKSKTFWSFLSLSLLFFLLRLPSLIEPDWYTDEGIYQVVGQALDKGRVLYSQIWDNKPPLLYLLYASVDGDLFWMRIISLIVGIATLLAFFLLVQKLFKNLTVNVIATFVFVLLLATPLLDGDIANAENFMLLPIIITAYLIAPNTHTKNQRLPVISFKKYFLCGLLLGISFLFKTVGILDFSAFFLYLLFIIVPNRITNDFFQKIYSSLSFRYLFLPYIVGFLLPFLLVLVYFISNHALSSFIQSVFFGNVDYVGWGNTFVFPLGLLLLKLLLLVVVVVLLFWKRHKITQQALFVFLWGSFSLFNAFFSQRAFAHYLLVLIPSGCLLISLYFVLQKVWQKALIILISLILLICMNYTFSFNTFNFPTSNLSYSTFQQQFAYYQNALLYVQGKRSTTDYQTFFDQWTPRDYAVADFISNHIKSTDSVFIWGNRAQIYALSHTLPPGKFTVAYHITLSDNNVQETQETLNMTKPLYLVLLPETFQVFPFVLYTYTHVLTINGALIYERIY